MEDKKILIVAPSWVGDMVMAQTLFKLLKQHSPNSHIDVLAPGWTRPLLERMPEVDDTLDLPFGHGQIRLNARHQLGVQLRSKYYDHAILLPNSFKSALVPFWARIPRRTGWLGEMRWGLLNDVRILNKKALPLMIQRFAALAFAANEALPQDLPYPSFQVSEHGVNTALDQHQLHDSQGQPILALCPGAEFGPSKRWPASYFAQIAKHYLQQGWSVWLFGSAKDQAFSLEIQALTSHGCVDLVGKTALSEAVDLLSLSRAVVTNDSGLMHIAAALQKPLVALYGSTSPQVTPPLFTKARILSTGIECRPCFKRECPVLHHKCMQDLLPGRVLQALAEFGIDEKQYA